MPGVSEAKLAIVKQLVQSAPDTVVHELELALNGDIGADSALLHIRSIVGAEAAERRLRNLVLQPIAPLFSGDGTATKRLTFPASALPRLWKAVKVHAVVEMAHFRALFTNPAQPDTGEALAAVTARTLSALRNGDDDDLKAVVQLCANARPNGVALLETCLRLSPLVRQTIEKLPDWLARMTDERRALARLAYRDACAMSDEAGPCFFEMLAGQLAEPWSILRVISAVMDHPAERYLSASELASFGERVLDSVDLGLASIAGFNPKTGPEAGSAAAATVAEVTLQIAELEAAVELSKDGAWGKRAIRQKQTFASAVEGRLKEAEEAVVAALPTRSARFAKLLRHVPTLSGQPDPAAVKRATSLLTFMNEIRSSANYGGFAATRAKIVEKLEQRLDTYVEDVLDHIRSEEGAEDAERAQAYLAIAADFCGLIRDDRAADIVRRRAAAA